MRAKYAANKLHARRALLTRRPDMIVSFKLCASAKQTPPQSQFALAKCNFRFLFTRRTRPIALRLKPVVYANMYYVHLAMVVDVCKATLTLLLSVTLETHGLRSGAVLCGTIVKMR